MPSREDVIKGLQQLLADEEAGERCGDRSNVDSTVIAAAVAELIELQTQRDSLNHLNAEHLELRSRQELHIHTLELGVVEYERRCAEKNARIVELENCVRGQRENLQQFTVEVEDKDARLATLTARITELEELLAAVDKETGAI
jgi:chromosome segregation ATPase